MRHRLPTLADAKALVKMSQRVIRRLGALSRSGYKVTKGKRFLHLAQEDGQSLFYRPSEIAAVVRRFEDLGLADLLAAQGTEYKEDEIFGTFPKLDWENADITGRICDAVGAKAASIEIFQKDDPSPWCEFGEREADAWFLTNFAWFYSRQNEPNASIEWRLEWAHALGRLMQWKNFWFEGHDARVVSRMNSDSGWEKVLAGGAAENQERTHMRLRWEDWALQRAHALRSDRPSRNKRRLAMLIYAETEGREARAEAVGDCGHDPNSPRRFCFVCTRPSKNTIYNVLCEKFHDR